MPRQARTSRPCSQSRRDLRRPASNVGLSAIMGCREGEASKRAAKACGGAVVKEREGRTVRLSLPQRLHDDGSEPRTYLPNLPRTPPSAPPTGLPRDGLVTPPSDGGEMSPTLGRPSGGSVLLSTGLRGRSKARLSGSS